MAIVELEQTPKQEAGTMKSTEGLKVDLTTTEAKAALKASDKAWELWRAWEKAREEEKAAWEAWRATGAAV